MAPVGGLVVVVVEVRGLVVVVVAGGLVVRVGILTSAACSVVGERLGSNHFDMIWSLKRLSSHCSALADAGEALRLTTSTLIAPSWRSFSNVASMPADAQ